MDGLIKALSDVVIGGSGGGHDGENEARDERSRSSWAQVVSGDQDNEDRPPSQWRKQEQSQQDDKGWQVSGSRPSRRPQKIEYDGCEKDERDERHAYNQNEWSRKEQVNENNDGWETVGRKPRRRPQKVHMDNWQGYKRDPSEQEYAEDFRTDTSIEPSEEELADLSQACNKLWQLDFNRLVPGKDYQIDCGEGKKVYQKEDMAEESLFYSLNEDIFRKPTFSRFCALLDNYNPNAGCKEVVTAEEKQEQSAFIEEISRTAPIKYLHRYLYLKGIVSENYQDFKRILTKLWFDLYARGGTSGSSSAFEHVFVGEIKQRGEEEVTGFHNWLQFYLEEAKGRVDYQGYILPRRRGETPDSETQLLTIQFEWNGVLKAVASTLVGVSPEFELALYSLCFFVGGEDNHVELGPYSVNIKCYRFGDKIGSVFPIAE